MTNQVEDAEIFEVCQEFDGEPFGVTDVSPQLEIGYERTRGRLNKLVDDGLINKRRIGHVGVYWLDGF